jgi:undecaprenyl diphosphate synthase
MLPVPSSSTSLETTGGSRPDVESDARTGVATELDSTRQFLRHVMVVGGTLRDWADLGDQRWTARVDDLGRVADRAGASFLTLRAFEPGVDLVDLDRWERTVGSCRVIVDPCGDGRQRFADAMRRLDPADPVNEATVAEALYDPADCEPDLIVVLGEPTRLPPSLVWELAYGELVFHPLTWPELAPDHLVDAIADFARRERRFGGLEE